VKCIAEIEIFERRYNPHYVPANEIPVKKSKGYPYTSAAQELDKIASKIIWKSSEKIDISQARVLARKAHPDLARLEREAYQAQTFGPYGAGLRNMII
jgi:hypothetical protein